MNKELFLKIVYGVRKYDNYFMTKQDGRGLWGFTSIEKCNDAMRCLAYRAPPDTTNAYLRMEELTCIETLYKFCRAVTMTTPAPANEMGAYFATCQEAARKDVERAFGVLQQHLAVVRYPTLTWSESQM
ncbi:uncharacterized protein [Lolium perenne]|uniref:uncharacterized protein n=1 Tax=Lolium perenne TaxID=4522 RepID=UPI003A995263